MALNSVTVESKVVAVTVYESRAQVHRSGTIKLLKGATTVKFSNFPTSADRDSVQVGLKLSDENVAADALTLNGITFEQPERKHEEAATKSDEQARLEEKIKTLEEKLEELTIVADTITEEENIQDDYFKMAVVSRGNDDPSIYEDISLWEKVIAGRVDKDREILERRRAQRKEAEDTRVELKQARDDLRKAQAGQPMSKPQSTRPLVLVHLEANVDVGEVEILLSYMVNDASWTAAYDLRVDREKNTAAITYHAVVKQGTDETWRNVSLTMSTAKPAVSGRAPDLSRWYARVSFRTYRSKAPGGSAKRKSAPQLQDQLRNKKESKMAREEEEAEYMEDDEDEEMDGDGIATPASFDSADASAEGGTAVTFDVPNRHTVPCNNDPVRVSLTVIQLTPEFTYVSRPSAAEVCYAVLNATNTSTFTIMPGEANVFVDGQFITKTTLPRISSKNHLRVSIGEDAGISVKYKAIKEENSEAGGGILSSKKYKREYFKLVTIKNQKDVPVSVRVEHEYPTASDSRVEITLVEPAWVVKEGGEPKEGKLVVPLELKAREEKKVNIQIAVQYPTDLSLIGL
jgi:uncharacterized protein (TIGR02231 family)